MRCLCQRTANIREDNTLIFPIIAHNQFTNAKYMWDIGKAIALVRCLNVLRNHNIALSLFKSHIYIQNMNGASMQKFHKHTRYQNKCGLYFTLANESCGSFTLRQVDTHLTAQRMVFSTKYMRCSEGFVAWWQHQGAYNTQE